MQTLYEISAILLELAKPFAPYIVSIVTGVGGMFIGQRKRKADAAKAELENVQEAIRIWRETAEALQAKVDELMREIDKMRTQSKEVLEKLQLARDENSQLKKQIQRLEEKLNKIDNQTK